ncbi:LysR family transcriptional regulator [Pseudomonas sp. NW5]|uniref:LysR family transcriptional regulator n=1 Tax=Pseudomonas sp. NW5 TaxID=2934934 RepID=UPI0020206350|nr:LysR family transcriptional regulator [Pseudomonas sp. NW5]MCL7461318.1 LysR family transcriptional regulator [Pseudomonas sp. NW5]
MNRLEAMALFVRVAELGSFAAAASQLGVARSVVTRQIAALEAHLGSKLMVRSTRRLTLTTAGSTYLEKCRTILALVEEAESGVMEARQEPSGPLRISLPLSFGLRRLVPLLLEFARCWPKIQLSLDFSDRRQHLIESGIALSIRIMAQPEPGDIVRRLGSVRLQVVAAPDYLARHGCPQHPQELKAHTCLGYSQYLNNQPWQFSLDGQLRSLALPLALQANNGDALAEAAAQGMGISQQPDFIIAPYLADGRLVTLLQAFEPPPLGIYALLAGNRFLPHRVRVLIDFLAERLAEPSATPPSPSPQ